MTPTVRKIFYMPLLDFDGGVTRVMRVEVEPITKTLIATIMELA